MLIPDPKNETMNVHFAWVASPEMLTPRFGDFSPQCQISINHFHFSYTRVQMISFFNSMFKI